jgi:hypothetical protein
MKKKNKIKVFKFKDLLKNTKFGNMKLMKIFKSVKILKNYVNYFNRKYLITINFGKLRFKE